ncbi:hypothetical protein FQN49_002344 [Arthroderma sp. PD_2]|nr:hypothetical protein FQN49_002344 [Arthroderma sp. PD_2]
MESLKNSLQAAEDALLGHKSGQEPVSGVKGQGTATDPYDAGNATNQPTGEQGMTGKHAAGQQAYGGNKVDEGISGLDDTAGRTTGKPTTAGYTSQESSRLPGQTMQGGAGRVDEGISGIGGNNTGYGDKAVRSEMQQGGEYSSAMGTGQQSSMGSKMTGGTTSGTTGCLGGATAAGAVGGAAGASAMGYNKEPGTSMKQQPSMTEGTGRSSDLPTDTSGAYGQGKQTQLGSEYGREPSSGAALGSGNVTGTGGGTQYQYPSKTTHGQQAATGGVASGTSQYPSEMRQGQTTGAMPGGSSSMGSGGAMGYGSSGIGQEAPTATRQTAGGVLGDTSGSGYGGSQYSSGMKQGAPTTSQTTGGGLGSSTGAGYGGSQPSGMKQGAPTASTSSRTTGGAPSGGPASMGEDTVKSTGFAAEGGNFDAKEPGAGREADRLLDERPTKSTQGTHGTTKSTQGNTATSHEPHTGTGQEAHSSHRTGSIAQKAKEALHIGKHKS